MGQIEIKAKPNLADLEKWYKKGSVLKFKEANGNIHHGKLSEFKPIFNEDDALLWIKSEKFGFYLRNVISYTYSIKESIFSKSPNPHENIIIICGDQSFYINKMLLCERSTFFNSLLLGGFKEQNEKKIDLSMLFLDKELETFFKLIDAEDLDFIKESSQALFLLDALDRTGCIEQIDEVKNKFFELCSFEDYQLLLKNRETFGIYSQQFLLNLNEEIQRKGKPSLADLEKWYIEGSILKFNTANGNIHHGKLSEFKPFFNKDDALLWIKAEKFGFYLRDVISYTYPIKEAIDKLKSASYLSQLSMFSSKDNSVHEPTCANPGLSSYQV